MEKVGYVYILSNPNHTVLYTGVTSNLTQRVWQHKNKAIAGFTAKYNACELVYFEVSDDIESAIEREKQIKSGSRAKKVDLINGFNPGWVDLYETII